MSDFTPFLAIFANRPSFVGVAEKFEHELDPFADQLDLGPGDTAIVAQSQMPLEQDLVFAKVLDASEFAAAFPDWETRTRHRLCELFSRLDPEIWIGWVSCLKLMPIDTEQYETAATWLVDGFPDELPKWTEEVYKAFSLRLSTVRPDIAPVVVTCPFCNSDEVALFVERTIGYKGRAGRVVVEGQERIVPVTELDHRHEHKAWLQCLDCKAKGTMEDGEWTLPGLTN